jgi:cytochrome c oxidase accessory protein FixG
MAKFDKDKYRESISTVDESGNRVWVYPKKPKGKLTNWRKIVAYSIVAFFAAAPFIKVNGLPLILMNVVERKFVIFGSIFWPQDFVIFAVGFIVSIVFLVLFTVIYGRIFCGWVCPQTIFMEFIFRRIEYLIEGDYTKQKKLNRMDWNAEKIFKKTLKHTIFAFVAFLTANLLLAYVISVDELYKIITDPIGAHKMGLLIITVFSAVFYWIFAFFREQVCIIACPYGRLQGAFLDKDSVVVAYDHVRGEERGPLRKNEERTQGDCIDCKQCVHVCPTGIDIRNGTQLECINCTACIDECDSIMDMIGKPKKLIGYFSENNIEKKEKFKFSGRVIAYSTVLVVLLGFLGGLLMTREVVDVAILRSKGLTYTKTAEGDFQNVFEIKIINKSVNEIPLSIKLENREGKVKLVGHHIVVPSSAMATAKIIVTLTPQQMDGMETELEFGFYDDKGEKIIEEESVFLGPYNLRKK